ncbi:TIGR00730 family Rossman fold protein [Porticoccaceae bacterium LTM1]|nr:TIGR00730 family Rossman fold protein [Porticoccaceae bacterium LTM1]
MKDAAVPEAWRVLRIQSELVDGIENLSGLNGGVIVFGGARIAEGSPLYRDAERLGEMLGKEGVSVITGGGPGIMEAANRGCFSTASDTVGLNITLPTEQKPNPYQDISLEFRYFFVRKFMFVKHAAGFVIYPGGYGTMDELYEALMLVQTGKVMPFPIVLVNSEFWQGLIDWMIDQMISRGCITERELQLITLVDNADQAAEVILKHVRMLKAQEQGS